jgi:hypothetical protein
MCIYLIAALLVPLLIYLTTESPTSEVQTSPIPPELSQLCHTYCSTRQPVTCPTGHNCSQAELCSMVEILDNCKQVCIITFCSGSSYISLTTSTLGCNRIYIMWGSYYDQLFLQGILPFSILLFCKFK